MKIFFSTSFRENVEMGRKMYQWIGDLGYTHTSDVIMSNAPECYLKWNDEQRQKHYQQLFAEFHQADMIVLEGSQQSLTTGQLIQEALHKDIPLLILVRDKAVLNGLKEQNHRLLICEYTDENAKSVLIDGIEYLSAVMDVRFTMILPRELVRYLDTMTQKSGLSRSEYIRNLMYADLRADLEKSHSTANQQDLAANYPSLLEVGDATTSS